MDITPDADRAKMTILLVEDSAVIALVEQRQLEGFGYKVELAATGEEAVAIGIGRADIDLVLMDVDLGAAMDGVRAAELILEKRELPIVFISSHTEQAIVERTERVTSYGFVLKNSGPTVLEASLKMAFRLHDAYHAIESRERSLAESAARMESTLAAAPVGIGTIRDRTVLDANERYLQLTGFEPGEQLGKPTRMLFESEEEYLRVGEVLYSGCAETGVGEVETRYRRRDGSFVDVLIRLAAFPSSAQRRIKLTKDDIIHNLATFSVLDISDRKRAERAMESRVLALTEPGGPSLTGEELRFEALFDLDEIQQIQDAFSSATGVASIITDADGRPITKPSNFTRLCDSIIRGTDIGCANCMHSDAMLGRMNPDGPLMASCLSGGLLDGGAGISVGDKHIANWLIGQVVDDDTDFNAIKSYAALIGADQADFDAALAEVPRMSGETFSKVCNALFVIARQLSTLAYRNVQQARAIVERNKAEEEKDALYRELKHRIKNGMALMMGLVDLEAGRSKEAAVHKALSATRARIESLATLYDLLSGSANPNEIRLDEYLGRIAEVVESTFADAVGVTEFRLDMERYTISARAAAPLALVLMELLTNSLKYAFPEGRGGIVSVALKGETDGALSLSVQDDGVGLPADFDPRTSKGLGMELIRMLVLQLGGELSFRSGPGTRFEVRLSAERIRFLAQAR